MKQQTIWAVLAGLGTGVIAGLLIAPKAGRETITDLTDAAGTWRGKLADQWNRILGQADGRVVEELQNHQDELVHADFNNPEDLPHRPRVESQA